MEPVRDTSRIVVIQNADIISRQAPHNCCFWSIPRRHNRFRLPVDISTRRSGRLWSGCAYYRTARARLRRLRWAEGARCRMCCPPYHTAAGQRPGLNIANQARLPRPSPVVDGVVLPLKILTTPGLIPGTIRLSAFAVLSVNSGSFTRALDKT